MPASRDLAAEPVVSRNTVIAAYEQLQSEGYLKTRAGSGTFVSNELPEPDISVGDDNLRGEPDFCAQLTLSRRGEQLSSCSAASQRQCGAFMPGVPDVRHFPHKTWQKIVRRLNARLPVELLSYSQHGGYRPLQHALVEYLRVARSVKCTADQILITSGTHQSLDLLAKMLCNPGDQVWVEEPGYWGHRSVLEINGLESVPLAEFIREGHYAAHVRQMRQLYSKRREALVEVICRELGPEFIGQNSNAGLHLILALPEKIDDVALSAELELQGIWTRPLSVYYRAEVKRRGLILGYACVAVEAMAETFMPIVRCLASPIVG